MERRAEEAGAGGGVREREERMVKETKARVARERTARRRVHGGDGGAADGFVPDIGETRRGGGRLSCFSIGSVTSYGLYK